MWGTTLDTILEMEVVLADGSIVTTSRTQNEDLFWVCQEKAFTLTYTKEKEMNLSYQLTKLGYNDVCERLGV
jgi:FAD/FMN-containing dehydrogenase